MEDYYKAVCHWGWAEDVCLIIGKEKAFLTGENTYEVPMTKEQAKKLMIQLKESIDKCEELEQSIPKEVQNA